MEIIVNITGFTGSSPFYIYVSDVDFKTKFYVDSGSTIPKKVVIPPPYNSLDSFGVTLLDSNNCETSNIVIP